MKPYTTTVLGPASKVLSIIKPSKLYLTTNRFVRDGAIRSSNSNVDVDVTIANDTIFGINGQPIFSVDEADLDRPTEGFSSIEEAIEDVRKGKVGVFVNVIIVSSSLCIVM